MPTLRQQETYTMYRSLSHGVKNKRAFPEPEKSGKVTSGCTLRNADCETQNFKKVYFTELKLWKMFLLLSYV